MDNVAEILILQPGGTAIPASLPCGEYVIGRGDSAKIRLRSPDVSERHALLRVGIVASTLEDCGSSNGTWSFGGRLMERVELAVGQEFEIGPYKLIVKSLPKTAPMGGSSFAHASEPHPHNGIDDGVQPECQGTDAAESELSKAAEARRQIKNQIHRELVQRLDLKRMSAMRSSGEELAEKARKTLNQIIEEVRGKLPAGLDPQMLTREIFNEALRLGPLEDFLADDSITEIMVNGPHRVFIEKKGKIFLSDKTFMDDASVLAIIDRIVSPIGRRIDESQPYVDARLPDGSRVNAIISPLSLVGPCITIRKFSKIPLRSEDFVRFGTWTEEIAKFLEIAVKMRKNIIVAGGTGSGKTTLLNVLSSFIPKDERIVTIEDAAELRLEQPHLVRLEARAPNIEGKGAVTIRDLVRNALRMRPDRIIVGECRSGEALDMLQAMNTGHDGSLTTVHANSPRDVISRLETMVLMSGMELPSRAIREQISSAVDLIVHESRFSDGSRRISAVTEVLGMEGTQTVMQDIFVFRQTGVDENGKVLGKITPTGAVPTFFEQIKSRGLVLDPVIFQPEQPMRNGGMM